MEGHWTPDDEIHTRRVWNRENPDEVAQAAAMQDQTRAACIEKLREARAYLIATVVLDPEKADGPEGCSIDSTMSVGPGMPAELVMELFESVAAAMCNAWFMRNPDPISLVALVGNFTETAIAVHGEFMSGGEG